MKACSDFDMDCFTIEDPLSCWMGHSSFISEEGLFFQNLPVADGFCPLINQTHKEEESFNAQ